ncbi:MAG: hypothetical protein KF878_07580 [Planctomycetes bacterium]|nr:hypothetical protein [Planctomycetota bacterium]
MPWRSPRRGIDARRRPRRRRRGRPRAPDPSKALAPRGGTLRRALDTDAEDARAWLLAQAVSAPDLARAVAEAVARPPTRSGLELATDVALALGDERQASERARAARAAGSPEAWWRARLDLADDVGRLEDARQELLRLRVPPGAPVEELLLGWTPERSQAIARHLRRLAAPRGPGEVYPALGAAGEALGRRLLAGLLALDGQLQWLPEKEAMTAGELAGLLRQAEAAAPGSLEARGVEVLRRACAWSAGARGPAERRQELEALDRLLAGDLPPAQRRGALRARYGLVDRQGAAAELARAEEALGGEEELVSRLAFEHRLRLARAHVFVGWSDGARREASARRALEVVAGAPPTHQMFFGKLAREEVAALLVLGRVPGSDVLERLDATDFKVTEALLAVADGRAAEAIAPLQGLADLQVRRADGRSTYDAGCTLALALALTGDLPDARRTLEALPKDGWLHWLPWNQPDTVGRAVDLIERGVWRPSLTQVFPPP